MDAISSTLSTLASASTSTTSSVARTADASFAQNAVALSADSAVVSLLGVNGSAGRTYDASGLFNAVAQAGTLAAGSGQASVDQQVLASLQSANAGVSGLDALAAKVAANGFDLNASYAAILKQRPAEASSVIADATAQGIISSISTWA
ncbi:MAG TPA: hypothetical protein VFF16_18430 [Telluria sp.]|nr:hypothetical protein [Telluria sp.]